MRHEPSFSKCFRGRLGVAVLTVCLAVAGSARGESAADTTQLRRSGELSEQLRRDTYEWLTRDLHELLLQQDVMARVRGDLEGAFDGTPQMAMKVHLLDLTILQDLGGILPQVGASIEELRLQTQTEIARNEVLRQKRQTAGDETQQRIDEMAGEFLTSHQDGGEAIAEDRKLGMEAVLYQLILKRDEARADAEGYLQSTAAGQKELRSLDRLDERLHWLAAWWAIYAERLQAAVENESESLIATKHKQHRQAIREAMALLRTAEEAGKIVVSTREQRPVHEGLPLDEAVDQVNVPLTPDQLQLVEEELRAAQERLAKVAGPHEVAAEETAVKP